MGARSVPCHEGAWSSGRSSIAISGKLAAHFSSVLIGVETGEEVENLTIQPDHGGDAFGSQCGFAHLAFVAHDDPQPSLGAGIDTNDVGHAAERSEVSADLTCGIRIAQRPVEATG
jgi:hypothetical protein